MLAAAVTADDVDGVAMQVETGAGGGGAFIAGNCFLYLFHKCCPSC